MWKHEYMTSSTKPEVLNVFHCRQRRNEPRRQVTYTENVVNLEVWFWDMRVDRGQTDKRTDRNASHHYQATPLGDDPVGISPWFWHRQTIVPGLSYIWRCLCDTRFSRLCRTPTCDRQTNRRTIDDGIFRGSTASRGKKRNDQYMPIPVA